MAKVDNRKFQEACEVTRENLLLSTYLDKNKLAYNITGGQQMIRCPFPDHDDGSPSFSYDDNKQVFNCFGCGRSGDVVNLHYYMNHIENERYTRVKALRELAKEFKIKIPDLAGEVEIKRERYNKFKRVNRKDTELLDKMYREKVKNLEPRLKTLSDNTRIAVYRKIDEMYLGKESPTNTYHYVMKGIKHENNKKLL